jgi:hypothetical protein
MNPQECLIYLKDIIILSSNFDEHIRRQDAVFSRLESHNFKLKANKCDFFQEIGSLLLTSLSGGRYKDRPGKGACCFEISNSKIS